MVSQWGGAYKVTRDHNTVRLSGTRIVEGTSLRLTAGGSLDLLLLYRDKVTLRRVNLQPELHDAEENQSNVCRK